MPFHSRKSGQNSVDKNSNLNTPEKATGGESFFQRFVMRAKRGRTSKSHSPKPPSYPQQRPGLLETMFGSQQFRIRRKSGDDGSREKQHTPLFEKNMENQTKSKANEVEVTPTQFEACDEFLAIDDLVDEVNGRASPSRMLTTSEVTSNIGANVPNDHSPGRYVLTTEIRVLMGPAEKFPKMELETAESAERISQTGATEATTVIEPQQSTVSQPELRQEDKTPIWMIAKQEVQPVSGPPTKEETRSVSSHLDQKDNSLGKAAVEREVSNPAKGCIIEAAEEKKIVWVSGVTEEFKESGGHEESDKPALTAPVLHEGSGSASDNMKNEGSENDDVKNEVSGNDDMKRIVRIIEPTPEPEGREEDESQSFEDRRGREESKRVRESDRKEEKGEAGAMDWKEERALEEAVEESKKHAVPVDTTASSAAAMRTDSSGLSTIEEKQETAPSSGQKSPSQKSPGSRSQGGKSPSPLPTTKNKSPSAQLPRNKSPSPRPPKDRSPGPQVPKEKAPGPQFPKEKSPGPQTLKDKPPGPQSTKGKSPQPSTVTSQSPRPAKEKSPSPQPSKAKSPSPHSSMVASTGPQPSKDKSASPRPLKEKSPSPQPPKSSTTGPQPPKESSTIRQLPKGKLSGAGLPKGKSLDVQALSARKRSPSPSEGVQPKTAASGTKPDATARASGGQSAKPSAQTKVGGKAQSPGPASGTVSKKPATAASTTKQVGGTVGPQSAKKTTTKSAPAAEKATRDKQ